MEFNKLLEEFQPVTTAQWKDRIVKDLKGADFDKKLVWQTGEGFNVQPFYRKEDIENLTILDTFPGDFPFIRGKKTIANDWLVRQDIEINEIKTANEKALDIRLKGVDSLGFILENRKLTTTLIEDLLHNIRADVMELNFSTDYPLEMVKIIDHLAKIHNRDLGKIRGSVDYDPLGYFSTHGEFIKSEQDDFSLLEEILNASALLPNFQVITVDGSLFHNSGSGIVTQLAFSLAKGSDYLTYLTNKGFDIDTIAPKIRFHFAVGSNYFMEIAKFRAARYLWAKIVNAYGLNDADNAAMFIHCSNSSWNKTAYDPYVNMLRTTTETMSSVIGGIDSMTVIPFNAVFEKPTDFSERIARNQQLVLKGESYFDKVIDPAAGSYYIENLTNILIHEVWKLFLEVDESGGYFAAFKNGFIQKKLKEEATRKNTNLAFKKQIILGTNQYPNPLEVFPDLDKKTESPSVEQAKIETIQPFRAAVPFENLRHKTDLFARQHGRPKAWMLTIGNPTMRKARSQFAGNFFGCAGFEIIDNPGFSNLEYAVAEAKKCNPELVVICSSDEEYATIAPLVFEALKNDTIVVLAGYPSEIIETLQASGMNNFIHMKSNLLEELKRYQVLVGIK